MDDLVNTKELVRHLLIHDKDTRNSDDDLFIKVCTAINKEFPELPLAYAMKNRKKYGIPAYETVRRARQKAQAEEPSLKSDEAVKRFRKEKEQKFRVFAKSKEGGKKWHFIERLAFRFGMTRK